MINMIRLNEYCKKQGFSPKQLQRLIRRDKLPENTFHLIGTEIWINEVEMNKAVLKFRPKRFRFPGPDHWLGRAYRRSWLGDH